MAKKRKKSGGSDKKSGILESLKAAFGTMETRAGAPSGSGSGSGGNPVKFGDTGEEATTKIKDSESKRQRKRRRSGS